MHIPQTRRASWVALAALLTACGGSGGGGGGPVPLTNAALAGTYFAFQFSGSGSPVHGFASTGLFTADGMGNASRTYFANAMGTTSGPTSQNFTYVVAPDGALALNPGLAVTLRGGVSADGDCALLGVAADGFNPGVVPLFRRAGAFSEASLAGIHSMVIFSASPASGDTTTLTGPVTFDGAGGGAFPGMIRNEMGVQTTSPSTFTYAVDGDGASDLTIGNDELTGGVVAGGALAIWGGSITGGGPVLVVVLSAATSATPATFQGDYWFVRVARQPVTGDYVGLTGTLTADGAGSYSLAGTSNLDGSIAQGSGAGTYTVSAAGQVGLSLGDALLPGGITQDGRFAILGGALGPGAPPPTICLLVRK